MVLRKCFGPSEYGIWVTTKIEAEKLSWSQNLIVDTQPNPLVTPECFFIGETKCACRLGLVLDTDIICWPHACFYVPSLVQIKQPAVGGKRKQHNDLETGYDKKGDD